MVRKILVLGVFLFSFNSAFAQTDTVDVEIPTGGVAQCVFNSKVPFHRITASNNNIVTDPLTGSTKVGINSELDTDKNTITVDILATVSALSDPSALLSGSEVTFESDEFDLSISKTDKKSGKTTNITNETAEGEKTSASATVIVKSFESNQAAGSVKFVFSNTTKTIQKLEEDIKTTNNGQVIVRCNFAGIPVTVPVGGNTIAFPVSF